ncbi:MAG: GNAT family N-acetyltransferase [Actinocrinis sp.]
MAHDARLAVLRRALSDDMTARYPEFEPDSDDHLTANIRFMLACRGVAALGCCAIQTNAGSGLDGMELKRMYVVPEVRGSSVAQMLLGSAEFLAAQLGAAQLYLETGVRQPEAIRFYERNGYSRIPLYPPYTESALSVSYAKSLAALDVDVRAYERAYRTDSVGENAGRGQFAAGRLSNTAARPASSRATGTRNGEQDT